jgi:hypothetical protein
MMRASTTPTRARRAGRWPVLILMLAILVLVAAACGTGAAPAGQQDANPEALPGDVSGGDASGRDEGGDGFVGGEQPPGGLADLADRSIIKTGEMTIEVANVATVAGQVRAMALELDGYVGGTSAGTPDEPATLTLRIPADRFDEALQRLHDLGGTVRAEATREEDVTSSIVDLEARIRNLEASERQYRLLLDKAEKIDDILSVQTRLDDVRGQIEQLKAQLEQLSGLAELATLTVSLVPASSSVEEATEGWDPGATLDDALAALVAAAQAIGTGLIWLAIVGVPALAVAGILLVLGRRWAPLRRRAQTPSEGPAE